MSWTMSGSIGELVCVTGSRWLPEPYPLLIRFRRLCPTLQGPQST